MKNVCPDNPYSLQADRSLFLAAADRSWYVDKYHRTEAQLRHMVSTAAYWIAAGIGLIPKRRVIADECGISL